MKTFFQRTLIVAIAILPMMLVGCKDKKIIPATGRPLLVGVTTLTVGSKAQTLSFAYNTTVLNIRILDMEESDENGMLISSPRPEGSPYTTLKGEWYTITVDEDSMDVTIEVNTTGKQRQLIATIGDPLTFRYLDGVTITQAAAE